MAELPLLSSLDDGPAKQALAEAMKSLSGSGVKYTEAAARFENVNPAGLGNYAMALGDDFAPKGTDFSAGSDRALVMYGGGNNVVFGGSLPDITATLDHATQANSGLMSLAAMSGGADRALS